MARRIVALALWLMPLVGAQSFNTASIKRAEPGRLPFLGFIQTRFRAQSMTLGALITAAYGVENFEIAGGPEWLGTDRFDVDARVEEGPAGLQRLLVARFHLAVHKETRVVPAYMLRISVGGSKLIPSGDSQCLPPLRASCKGMHDMGTAITAESVPMPEIVRVLASKVKRPVLDQTGLTGVFSLGMNYAESSIFAVLQEKAGLRLDFQDSPVEILVIDAVEKLPEN